MSGVINAAKEQAIAAANAEREQLNATPTAQEKSTDLGDDVSDEEELATTFKIPESEKKQLSKKGIIILLLILPNDLQVYTIIEKKTNHRDEEYYMHYTQKDANTEQGYSMQTSGNFIEQAGRAQLDLIGDDNDAMNQSRRNTLRWDAKKKKFVKGTGIGSDNKKMIRTESGALISASYKSGRFNEWARKKRISIPRTGEIELSSAKQFAQNGQRRFRHNSDSSQKRTQDGNVKSELKTAEQIRKQRKIKEKRREKNARPSKKQKRH